MAREVAAAAALDARALAVDDNAALDIHLSDIPRRMPPPAALDLSTLPSGCRSERLRPGMVLLRSFLSLSQQQRIIGMAISCNLC